MLGPLIVLILKTAFGILLISLVARFLAQIARADVRNPLAMTVLQITDPVLKPMRRIIPGIGGLDIASLLCIWIGQFILGALIILAMGVNPMALAGQLVVWSLLGVAGILLTVLQWSMIIVAIGSWIAMGQQNPLLGFLTQLVEPFVGPFRRLNLNIGMLDLSYIIAFLVLIILRDFILGGMILPQTGYSTVGGISPILGL